jgi:hypothetical protein
VGVRLVRRASLDALQDGGRSGSRAP